MNSCGGFTCYMISRLFLREIVFGKLKDQFEQISAKVKEQEDNLFFYLTFLRIFPGSPNWFMNISFAHIKSIKPY